MRVALLLLLGLLTALPVGAKKLYKYVDENGILHYTDREPDTEQPVESWNVRAEKQPVMTFRRDKIGDEVRIYAMNRWHGPVQLAIDLEKRRNIRAEPEVPADLVVEGHGEALVLVLSPDDPRQGWEYQLAFLPVPGDPDAQPTDYRYRLPFRAGKRFYVGQAFGGTATHTEEQSYYAVDFGMPVGTPILAARGGIVMHAEEDFFGSGLDPARYAERANNVRILHADGTMALYAHLELESVAVRPGQRVEAGELLGLSGNTGLSSGPHLHFVVQRNVGLKLVSIPFVFDDGSEDGLTPVAGEWLEHRRTEQR
ncbi:MAG: M23 family metallopeptidase [Pseudomonadota bacterium]